MKMGSTIGLKKRQKIKTKTEKNNKKKKKKENEKKIKQNTKQAYPRITVSRSEYSVSFPCALLSR